jgi:uncharacterized protein (TIGR02186 family)
LIAASAITPAAAERLVTSLSNHQVMVTSSFTGEELVLFGTVEQDAATPARPRNYDIVATITGPRQSLVTRRKDRVLGIWTNVDSRVFLNIPSYLGVLTTRPIADIAERETLRRLQVGIDNFILTQRIGTDVADVVTDDPFRSNFVRIQRQKGLYLEKEGAVTFLSPTLFRVDIPLPAEVPFGSYLVDVKLFADGAMVARDNSALEILKVGFEQFVATAAREHGLLYGLAAAMMALLTGWLASIIFRRD